MQGLIPRGYHFIPKANLTTIHNERKALITIKLQKKGYDTMVGSTGPIIRYLGFTSFTRTSVEIARDVGNTITKGKTLAAWKALVGDMPDVGEEFEPFTVQMFDWIPGLVKMGLQCANPEVVLAAVQHTMN